jgi:hypothetical protein
VLTDPAADRAAPAENWSAAASWGLVTEPDDGDLDDAALRMVAGPFADRLAADWAALAERLPAGTGARAVYGVRRADGALVLRPSAQE